MPQKELFIGLYDAGFITTIPMMAADFSVAMYAEQLRNEPDVKMLPGPMRWADCAMASISGVRYATCAVLSARFPRGTSRLDAKYILLEIDHQVGHRNRATAHEQVKVKLGEGWQKRLREATDVLLPKAWNYLNARAKVAGKRIEAAGKRTQMAIDLAKARTDLFSVSTTVNQDFDGFPCGVSMKLAIQGSTAQDILAKVKQLESIGVTVLFSGCFQF